MVRVAIPVVFGVAILMASVQVFAQPDIDRSARALDVIRSFADKFCTDVPSFGNRRQLDLSVDAKAELNGVLRKLVEIGVGTDNKFKSESYQGLLQKDLAVALRDRSNCKDKVWNDLKDRLLPHPIPNAGKVKSQPMTGGARKMNWRSEQASSSQPQSAQMTNERCIQEGKDLMARDMDFRMAMRDCQSAIEKPPPPSVYTFLHTESLPREICRDLYIDALEKEFPGKRTENYPAAVSMAVGAYRVYVACRRDVVVITVAGPGYDIAVRHATKLYERAASRGACPDLCQTALDPYRPERE